MSAVSPAASTLPPSVVSSLPAPDTTQTNSSHASLVIQPSSGYLPLISATAMLALLLARSYSQTVHVSPATNRLACFFVAAFTAWSLPCQPALYPSACMLPALQFPSLSCAVLLLAGSC